jgi:enoyl-CoA hydratase/carnithine racemase
MKTTPGFAYEEQAAVARITLDRPDSLNALTFGMYRGLTDAFLDLARDEAVRAVVITGRGRAFCTGGDVREIIGPLLEMDRAALLDFTRLTCDLIAAMRALPKPIVASLNGPVAGAGAVIALASDLRIASETARIAFLFVRVGLAGADMGAAWLLPRVVGLGRATELLMTGDFVDAAEALRIGLYNRVVPPERLDEETRSWARKLASGPAPGLAATKRALERELFMPLPQALAHEAEVQAELMLGWDFREGHRAFVEKRPPRFPGAPE